MCAACSHILSVDQPAGVLKQVLCMVQCRCLLFDMQKECKLCLVLVLDVASVQLCTQHGSRVGWNLR